MAISRDRLSLPISETTGAIWTLNSRTIRIRRTTLARRLSARGASPALLKQLVDQPLDMPLDRIPESGITLVIRHVGP
jgi:hypothetical protein